MYNMEEFKKILKKEGPDKIIEYLSTGNFPDEVRKFFEDQKIFCGGYPCLSIVYMIAAA